MPSPSKPRSVLAPDRRPSVRERRPDQRTLAHRDPHSPEAIRAARGWDVRLVPIAGAMWCAVASVVALRHWWAIAIVPAVCIAAVGIAAGCAAILPNRRTTIVRAIAAGAYTAAATVVCSAVAAVAAYVRVWRIDRNPLVRGVKAAPNRPGTHRLPTPPTSSTTSRLDLTISGSPRPTRNGGVHVPVDVDGLGDVPLFIPPTQLRGHPAPGHPTGVTSGADPREQILAWQPGTRLSITATVDASDRAGLVPITLTARDPIPGGAGGGVEVSEPTGLLALTAAIRRGLAVAADGLPADGGTIIPGMVVGDTSKQPIASRQEFIATGLSHLTAVSGSNVAVVTGTVVVACAALGLRKRARFVAAALALLGFVLVVGPEPSVLRAAIMGSVGLVAVVTSKWSDILAALSVATIVLCVAAPGVVTGYAFALSVAATAGIVVVSPWWARVGAHRGRGDAGALGVRHRRGGPSDHPHHRAHERRGIAGRGSGQLRRRVGGALRDCGGSAGSTDLRRRGRPRRADLDCRSRTLSCVARRVVGDHRRRPPRRRASDPHLRWHGVGDRCLGGDLRRYWLHRVAALLALVALARRRSRGGSGGGYPVRCGEPDIDRSTDLGATI